MRDYTRDVDIFMELEKPVNNTLGPFSVRGPHSVSKFVVSERIVDDK